MKTIKQLVENGEILQTGVNYYTLNDGQGSLHLELRRTPRKNAGNAPKRFVPYYTPPYSSPRTSPVSPSRRSRLNVTPSMRKTVNTLRKQLNELNGVKGIE